MPLLIKNGEIVTASERYFADIYCEGETITRIGKDLEVPAGTETIDASGNFVFPGFIDPHVHVYLPFMGTFAKDDHASASKAALVGGTTTFIEMAAPGSDVTATEGYQEWKGRAEGNSACDYAFHMGVTRFDDDTPAQLREIVEDGTTSFKVFLSYKGSFSLTDDELFRTLVSARELGVTVTAHCENAELVARRQQMLLAQGKTGPQFHEPSRPVQVEAEGTNRFATFLELTGARGYVVHLSCEPALKAALDAKARGVKLTIECVIPHLLLDHSYTERPDFEGAKFVMSPPLRTKQDQQALWHGLEAGLVDTVGTDHAPFDFEGQKQLGLDDFTKIPNGIPGIEDRVSMLYTYGVSRGNLDIHRFVDAASSSAARIFGLTQKGRIAVGADADLVVFDPAYRGTLPDRSEYMNVDYRGFAGFEVDGRPRVVTVRGQVAARDGKFVGDTSRGKLLRREPVHD